MQTEPIDPHGPAKRSRMEIKVMMAFVIGVIIVGSVWVAVHGSPTRYRAAIDSSANPTPTINSQPRPSVTH
jgi:hypothetical protein